MRRHVATFVAAALLFAMAGPAAAVDPASQLPESTPAPAVTPAPEPTPAPEATPAQEGTAAPEATSAIELPPVPDATATPEPPTDASPAPTATAEPAPRTTAADPTGRWIVVYKNGTDVDVASERQETRVGFTADRTFSHAFRGLTAKLSPRQVTALRNDPSVLAVVPDEKIELAAQLVPTGIDRIDGRRSPVARINGIDERVDADVAIVDTGISIVADLNVAGGYNCSTADRTLWRDVHGHGTHVAGTIGAIDNASGVVGVAPGVRLWAVKILDDTGTGLLSWYVCGLDWIAAQRDPADASRPRFESVNMSVAKSGSDDGACGTKNADILHAAICRLVASGVTVVAAAANDSANASRRVPAAYDEVITVSALADTDGKPGGLGGHRCLSWGSYDVDDTFADFSNYGADIDLIAPGKCIWSTVPGGYQYMSGTSMAAPHVTGAVALLKASRPQLTPAEVKEALQYLGTTNWKVASDPDSTHERLLNVSRLGPRGDFSMAAGPTVTLSEAGGTAAFRVTVTRTATSFERIVLGAADVPAGFGASFNTPTLFGFTGTSAAMSVAVPNGAQPGTYRIRVVGTEHGIVRSATATVIVEGDPPIAFAPTADGRPRGVIGATTVPTRVVWPVASDVSPIGGYEIQASVDGGGWSPATSLGPTVRTIAPSQTIGHAYRYRVRARDIGGNWSTWAEGNSYTASLVQDRSASVVYKGRWVRASYKLASGGSVRYATARGASVKLTFTGRAVAFVGPVGPTRGSAKVYFDGVLRGTVSFKARKNSSRLVLYSIGSNTLGRHTLEIRLVGNGRVDADAFVVFR
jgi:subtilisin